MDTNYIYIITVYRNNIAANNNDFQKPKYPKLELPNIIVCKDYVSLYAPPNISKSGLIWHSISNLGTWNGHWFDQWEQLWQK